MQKLIIINICMSSKKETNNIYSDRNHRILIMDAKYKHTNLLLIKIQHTGASQSMGNKAHTIINQVLDSSSNRHHFPNKDRVNILVGLIPIWIIRVKDLNLKHLLFSTNLIASNLARPQERGITNQLIKLLIFTT